MTREQAIHKLCIICGVSPASIDINVFALHAIVDRLIETEREKVAAWMIERGYATGHGDTIEDLLKELEWQVKEREQEAILGLADSLGWVDVDRIRARGEK